MLELNKIYCQDNVEGMRLLDDECIDLTVTSPPYDNLRQYNGYSFDFENVAKELYRVTKQGGVVVWVVGDATIKGSETGTSFRQALYFKEIGFNLHDTMIYRKVNPIPQNHNRYEQCYEYMFCLSKGKPKTFNPIMVKSVHGGEDMNWGGRKTLMDDAQCRRHRGDEVRTVKDTKRHDNIFDYTIGGERTGHPAVFPKLLARDQINTWSNEGDVVLDCFMGSGTTAVEALQLGRKYIGFEISQEYVDVANKRIATYTSQLRLDI